MEYLHKHKEEFINAVNLASEYFHILSVIVEKDYRIPSRNYGWIHPGKRDKVRASFRNLWDSTKRIPRF